MAGTKLYLATNKIWSHYFLNIERLQDNEDCVAENKETGWSVYLTSNAIFPQLVVYFGERPMLYRIIQNEADCNRWATYLIMKFVAGVETEGAPKKEEQKKEEPEKPKIIDLQMNKSVKTEEAQMSIEDMDEEDDEYQKIIDTIYEREDELSKAMGDFLAVAFCEEDYAAVVEGYGEPLINECVDDFMQYLFDKHGISAYRPTIDVDEETGCEVLKEFPYGWEEVEDEEDEEEE